MKIGVISDTHIPDRAAEIPQEICSAFKDADVIVHAGDLVELKVLEKLQEICPRVIAVCGNMDPDAAKKKLPQKQVFKAGKFKIALMHGYGHPGNLIEVMQREFKLDKPDLIIFGHSHVPMNEKIGGILYFNPGSCTDKVFAPYNSYGIIEINDTIKAKVIKLKDC